MFCLHVFFLVSSILGFKLELDLECNFVGGK